MSEIIAPTPNTIPEKEEKHRVLNAWLSISAIQLFLQIRNVMGRRTENPLSPAGVVLLQNGLTAHYRSLPSM